MILCSPFGLGFLAAALRRYPYGYSARFMLYLAPVICLLAGLGAARLISLIRAETIRFRALVALIVVLFLFGAGSILIDIIHPYKNLEDVASRDFARWFWDEKKRGAELVCVFADLGKNIFPGLFENGSSARYLCHQVIYSSSHRRGGYQPPGEAISAAHPLRCVVFSVPKDLCPYASRDEAAWEQWSGEMRARYDLSGYEKYTINSGVEDQHETYELYKFVPISGYVPDPDK